MQTTIKPGRNDKGYALLLTLVFLGVVLIVFASMMLWTSNSVSITLRNNQFNMSESAAEAATEKVLSQMDHDYLSQSLSNSGTYYGAMIPSQANNQVGWPVKYVYSDTNGVTNQISVNIGSWYTNTVALESQYKGLYGLVQPCTITATAKPVGQRYNVPATVSESLQFASIPLFQFAIFYNLNLEIDPGAAMPINGAVFSNAGIWSGNGNVTYNSTVAAVGTVYYNANDTAGDPFAPGASKTDTGTPAGNFKAVGTPISGADALTMPVGTNNNPSSVEAILNLPPTNYPLALGPNANNPAAFSTNGQIYLANAADLYLTNFPNGTNWGSLTPKGTNMILYYSDQANTPYLTQLPYDFYLMTNRTGSPHIYSTNYVSSGQLTNIMYAGYSFVTNVLFYDWREGWSTTATYGKAVQAVQLDISKLKIWLTNTAANGGNTYNNQCDQSNHKAHYIDSIYVYNAVPLTGTTLPAVRVMNGTNLPTSYGLTVVTPVPMYVWGNYNVFGNGSGSSLATTNTSHTYPAALMADAVTVLSTNWSDATTTKLPNPGNTTVNAAMLEGIVQSTNGIYSGGVENFLRLLENWSKSPSGASSVQTLTYNGSIVVMFPSQYATNYQRTTGNYYNAPTRNWGFDYNFTRQSGLPPLTPQSKAVIRGSWDAY
jgi:hypothetical protein